jgi:hypothetical protein
VQSELVFEIKCKSAFNGSVFIFAGAQKKPVKVSVVARNAFGNKFKYVSS